MLSPPWVFGVAALPVPGSRSVPPAPVLTSLVCVPKNGMTPFHPVTGGPWGDLADFESEPRHRDLAVQSRRTNARGAVVAAHAWVGGAPAAALPWHPSHEAPTWWEDFLRRPLPTAQVGPCADWDTVIRAVHEPGPGTTGVWVRRELYGVEATGHLLYAHNKNGRVALLGPQTQRLALLETENVREVMFARILPPPA
ncbi:toxin glutamine deamidase domain-containing protein [Streptomyces sp. NBC_00344]|uniref:toxin glutamine deamidase domain-containing protein n=1 Tax=Streptomyces sp. NBC_00344 TaxID=2975720 RepID=UPI002E1E2229